MPVDPLVESGRAVADANGVATATLGPYRSFERWVITGMATVTSSTTSESELRVYKGAIAAHTLVASSYSGNLDNAGGAVIKLVSGEQLIAQWTNADVGSECTITLQGERLR